MTLAKDFALLQSAMVKVGLDLRSMPCKNLGYNLLRIVLGCVLPFWLRKSNQFLHLLPLFLMPVKYIPTPVHFFDIIDGLPMYIPLLDLDSREKH